MIFVGKQRCALIMKFKCCLCVSCAVIWSQNRSAIFQALKGLRNTIRAAVRWPSQLGPFRLVGVAVTYLSYSFTLCSGFCRYKESGLVSIISTLRLFDVSQGVYEKKRIANLL